MKNLESILLWLVKIGLWAIPFLPLYIEPAMLFPFITGKNFAFRMMVEILFAAWAGLAVMREEFRPKLTPVFKTATIFIVILFAADILSPNPYRSLFSNYERMEGFMMLVHLYLYFVMLVSVFRRRDWIIFFHTTLIASVLVSYIAFLQKLGYRISMQGGFRVDSTIGNPTYLAAYLVFHLWILLLLAYNFWKKWWLEAIYALIFLFEFTILYFTATRGAILAMVLTGFLFLSALVVWWEKLSEKNQHGFSVGDGFKPTARGRAIAASLLAVVIAVPLILWLMRGTSFVQSNQVLRRLTNYSFQEDTIRARRMIWGMSWQGVLERPFLGWGQENYYLVFQKYYNPGLWSQEPWFDRSHNIIFDWLIHAGILGFAAFFAMVGAAVWGVFHALKKKELPFWAGLVVLGVFISHIIQDIFVFDNLNTYILFFAFLAYANFAVWGNSHEKIAFHKASARAPQGLAVLSATIILVIFAGYFLHVKPINEAKALITALTIQQRGSADQIIGAYQKALSYDSFGNTEVREQIGNVARSIPGNERFTKEEQQHFIEFAVDEFRKETSHSAKDVKHLLFYGAIIDRALDLKSEFAEEGVRVLEEAVAMSPKKQMLAFELAQMYMNIGKNDRAAETLRDAWRADHSYPDARVNAWVIAIIGKKPEIAAEIASATDFVLLKEPELYRIAQAYQKIEEYKSAVPIYAALVKVSPTNPKYHAVYAAHLAFVGRYEEARAEARESMRVDPNFKAEAESFLESIRGK
ncbi:MAG: O-antigen ligase family protein [Candidatus Sungbacteria bacterium]|nr:O-antigen ligase family protein [Candidatus Sungbacteria bacterium]